MTKPRIAVTVWKRHLPTFWDPRTALYALAEQYVEVLRAAGAIPLLVAHPDAEDVDAILDVVDGLIVTGGGDIDPASYGAARDEHTRDVNIRADMAEIALLRTAQQRELPTLGICRGMQILNVALGGTMHQHITTAEGPHRPEPTDPDEVKRHGHEVTFDPDSRLARLYGTTHRTVNSYHHQAVDRIADGLRVTAHAPDGVVEALEATTGWDCLGVQWHPEKTLDGTDQVLFDAFVKGTKVAIGTRV
jgi:putative glutamine amidotransferase